MCRAASEWLLVGLEVLIQTIGIEEQKVKSNGNGKSGKRFEEQKMYIDVQIRTISVDSTLRFVELNLPPVVPRAE
jgi:hypothetical protein